MLEQWFSKCGVGSLGGSSILSFWKYEFFLYVFISVYYLGFDSSSSLFLWSPQCFLCLILRLLPSVTFTHVSVFSLLQLLLLIWNFFVSLVLHLVLLRTFCLIVQIWFSCVLLPSCFHFPLLCRSSRVLRLSLCLSSLVRSLFFPLKFMDSFKFYVAICCAFGFLY